MEPVFADFSTTPAQLSNAVVTHHRCGIAPSHLALGAGGHIKVDFTVDGWKENEEAVVTVTVLGTGAPMDVLLNGKTSRSGSRYRRTGPQRPAGHRAQCAGRPPGRRHEHP